MGMQSSSPVKEGRLGLLAMFLDFFGDDGSGGGLDILKEVVILVLAAEIVDGLEAPAFLVTGFGLGFGPVTFEVVVFLPKALAGSGALSLSLVGAGFDDFGRGLGAGVRTEGSNVVFGGNGTATDWLALTRSTSEIVHNSLSLLWSSHRLIAAWDATSSQAPFTTRSKQSSNSFPTGGGS